MTIRNRRRNRWRRKLRQCNQCKHFWHHSYSATRYTPNDSEWGCSKEDTPEVDKLNSWTFRLEEQVERHTGKPHSTLWEEWWARVAPRCPHYQAYDRSANQLAQSTQRVQQRMSITEVKPL